MRIMLHSVSPGSISGYGNTTRKLIRSFHEAGYEVSVGTKHRQYGRFFWEGAEVFPGTNLYLCNDYLKNFDYILTLWDIWKLDEKIKFPKEKWIAHVPISSQNISEMMVNVLKYTSYQLAISKHVDRELKNAGFDSRYAPYGIETNTFRPKPSGRKSFRDGLGIDDDTFIIGQVGVNYSDDRKGIIPLMLAFKEFNHNHPKSALYLHVSLHAMPGDELLPLDIIAKNIGIQDSTYIPNQVAYNLCQIGDEELCDIYNGFDVFCLPTKGEGFGIPTAEAQSCGIPVILSDNTTGPDLCKAGWLIDCFERDKRWTYNNAWRYEPQSDAILEALERAYSEWNTPSWGERKNKSRELIMEYDWEVVWRDHWKPVFDELQGKL